jgi:2,3-bisphosphoglycerate-independent phosphoglycerate mutase
MHEGPTSTTTTFPIKPPHTASKGVVLYGDGFQRLVSSTATSNEKTILEDVEAPALQQLASLGCGGVLLPRAHSVQSRDRLSELVQLFGGYQCLYDTEGNLKEHPDVSSFATRYGRLKVGLLSDDAQARRLAEQIRFPVSKPTNFSVSVPAEEIADQLFKEIETLVLSNPVTVELLFVHIGKITNGDEAEEEAYIRHGIRVFDRIVAKLLNMKNLYIAVVTSSNATTTSPQEREAGKVQFYRPVQSCTVVDSVHIPLRYNDPMSAIYYHEGTTRRDAVSRFTERECRENGANGQIAVQQFLSELAFKLGKTPKYGA